MSKPVVVLPGTFKSRAAADAATKRMAQKLGVTVGAKVAGPTKKRKVKSSPKGRATSRKPKAKVARRRNPNRPHKAYVIRSERVGVGLGGKFYAKKELARAAAKAAAKRTGFGVKIRKVMVLKGQIVG